MDLRNSLKYRKTLLLFSGKQYYEFMKRSISMLCVGLFLAISVFCHGADASAEKVQAGLQSEFEKQNVPQQVQEIIMQRAEAIISKKGRPLTNQEIEEGLMNIKKALPKLKDDGFENIQTQEDLENSIKKFFLCPLFPFC